MSKEEKSKEYALLKLEENRYRNFHGIESVECAYSVGYTQSEQDLSSQLTAYKEALSSLWSDIHFTDISKEQIMDRIGSLIQPKS